MGGLFENLRLAKVARDQSGWPQQRLADSLQGSKDQLTD
jgi:hypothetical protein